LEKLFNKGDTLPRSGMKAFRAAKTLKPADEDFIDVEVFQYAEGVPEPENNLSVGSTRIPSSILDEGQALRRGDEVLLHWSVDENGLLNMSVELPSIERHLERQFFIPELSQHNFSGEDGRKLVGEALAQADNDIETLQEDLGDRASTEISALRRRQQRLLDKYGNTDDAEDMRSLSDEARHIRQDSSRLRQQPAFRHAALSAELTRVSKMFSEWSEEADSNQRTRAEQLTGTARRGLADHDYLTAERAIGELEAVTIEILQRQPGFILGHFELVARQQHLASDALLHDQLVTRGVQEAEAGDIDALRGTIFEMYRNRAVPDVPTHNLAALAGLMTH